MQQQKLVSKQKTKDSNIDGPFRLFSSYILKESKRMVVFWMESEFRMGAMYSPVH